MTSLNTLTEKIGRRLNHVVAAAGCLGTALSAVPAADLLISREADRLVVTAGGAIVPEPERRQPAEPKR